MLLSYFDNKKSGPTILFIHGTGAASEIWEEQFKALEEHGYRVIGIDLRGHGKSRNPGGICTMDDHLIDLNETLEKIDIKEKITIVGHSFGAVLACKFTEKYPYRINKLLLVSLPPKVPLILQQYYRWLLGKPIELIKNKKDVLLKLPLKKKHKLAISSDLNVIRQIWKDSLNWDFLNSVPEIKCPVYLSVGRFDYVALKNLVKKFHSKLPNSNYKEFFWSSHTCMLDEPKEFNKWIFSTIEL